MNGNINFDELLKERERAQCKSYEIEEQLKKYFSKFEHLSVSMVGDADIEFYMSFGHFNFDDEEEFLKEMKEMGFELSAIYDASTHKAAEKGLFLNFVRREK